MGAIAGGRAGRPIGLCLLVLLVASAAALLARSGDAATDSATGHLRGVAAIAAGNVHTCAVTKAGGVVCWGFNALGELGDGTTTERQRPVAVSGLASGIAAISAGDHTCALTSAGGLDCWGDNNGGSLGDGTRTARSTPVAVSGLPGGVVAVATGWFHTCALTSAGGVDCWGGNLRGALGNGTRTGSLTPVAVSGLSSGVAAISAAGLHTCALMTAGTVECWGENYSGQLGDGTTTDRSTPVVVSGLSGPVAAIAAGVDHTCALTSAGGVECWGDNEWGELGDGTTTNRSTAGTVSGLSGGVVAVTSHYSHTCALTSAGRVECWGDNEFGELGDGTTTQRHTPVVVSGLLTGVIAVSAGDNHTCVLTSAGGVECWGDNEYGQLGDGTKRERHRPVEVLPVGRPCLVPNALGSRLAEAKAKLTRAHCRVGKIRYVTSTSGKKGRVLRERPRPHTKLANDSRVGLTVGRGPSQR